MSRYWGLLLLLFLVGCQSSTTEKIPVFAWTGGPGDASDEAILSKFKTWKAHGIDGLLYNGGHDPATYARIGKIAKSADLAFHTWIPTMVQAKTDAIQAEWYGINRKGERALEKPAYVDYYTFLCPNHEGVYQYLSELYTSIAAVPEVDGIHLDYIRFPDVILARGLWDKYGLVMDKEYPDYDYCYGKECVDGFKAKTGIDILAEEDPSQVEAWKQYRYDLITSLVNRIAADVHAKGKEIHAAVFPGPNSVARRIVRQEWDKWELDAFYPMNYNDFYLEKPEWVGTVTKEGVDALAGKAPLYSGLFICPKPEAKTEENDPENHGLLPSELGTAISASMENGAKGICLFTPDRMTDAHWDAFKKAIHQSYSAD